MQLSGLVATVALAALASSALAQPAKDAVAPDLGPDFYAGAHQAVEVEPGRHLNLVCLGQGAPTVVLESGMGDDSLAWRKVQARIATFTRTCAYDRAGYGLSDAAQRASDADNTVEDLALLLDKAPITGPVVLVGHSLGGLYATHFTNLHPDRVAGMVLMDPAQPGDGRAYGSLWDRGRQGYAQSLADSELCLKAAREADLTPTHNPADCLEDPPGKDPAFHEEINRRWGKAKYIAANISEIRSMLADANGDSLDSRQAGPKQRDFGALPLIVLVSSPAPPPGAPEDWNRGTAIKHDLNRRLAARSTTGEFRLVPDSRHYIQDDAPQVVVEAVRSVVDAARESPPAR
ncbi:putative hydrolase or acyltransferase of alpha/beta superfamily [Caulobacter sp. AP07]|uniref:alpha/beta hydrolase n=1 Tax=Caulobacter sp. AP07 TaxID=1144304 RepID=UPI00027225A7|nr:alpha/beta hydrolase [Caulobacter sp. AP07]EJL24491.1 putative hydrolase or acyltransferase of alpha/beta superfamily [Caulobacter sp. AP07]